VIEVRRIAGGEAARHLDALADVLADCVTGGASVGFMAPFTVEAARAWWQGVLPAVDGGASVLFGAFDGDKLVGTAQLGLDVMPNQLHRADVKKLLVHRRARGKGVASALMAAIEAEARIRGLTLMTLDTCAGTDAERLYRRLGWTAAGVIPNYAKMPDGGPCDTVIFWKAP
jgi:GNAT superfamily N-acetyltransferase